jgi:predicted O-methyltransferase YrrM
MQPTWTQVEDYLGDLLVPSEETLDAALAANEQAGLPSIDVSRMLGKFLHLLVKIAGARKVLEIGTLGGFSTIWLARALPEGGRVITLESEPHHADVATLNLHNAGVLDRVDMFVGLAADSLPILEASGEGPFDLIFIDADKESYPEYLDWALRLSHAGTVIVADNVVRDGKVADPACKDVRVQGVQRFLEKMAAEPRLSATALQCVGSKGYDGFALAVVVA